MKNKYMHSDNHHPSEAGKMSSSHKDRSDVELRKFREELPDNPDMHNYNAGKLESPKIHMGK